MARPKGSKDRQKRNRRNLVLAGTGLAAIGLGGIGLANKKVLKNLLSRKKTSKVDTAIRKVKTPESEIPASEQIINITPIESKAVNRPSFKSQAKSVSRPGKKELKNKKSRNTNIVASRLNLLQTGEGYKPVYKPKPVLRVNKIKARDIVDIYGADRYSSNLELIVNL